MAGRPLLAAELTEKDLERQVVDLAKALGWRRYHTYRSKRSPSGFPDECLVRERLIFLELKSATGKLSPAQKDWLRALVAAGVECYLVRPDDLEDLARVLGTLSGQYGPGRRRLKAKLAVALE